MRKFKKVESIDIPQVNEVLSKTPKESKVFISKSMEIAYQISLVLKDHGVNQKYLADALGKSEPEISKWLSGTHNFTVRTLAAIEAALGREIVVTPYKVKNNPLNYTTTLYRASVNEEVSFGSSPEPVHMRVASSNDTFVAA